MTDLEKARAQPADTLLDPTVPCAARQHALALIDEGNALQEQGRTAEAMALYDAAVQVDPGCARAHLNRGNVLLRDARVEDARNAYILALACDPHYAAAHFNLGNLNSRSGDYQCALANYQQAIRIRPDFANAFVAMANVLDSLGRTAEAIDSYQRALAIEPCYAEVHFNLAVLAMNQGRHQQAASSLRSALDIRPDYPTAHYALGRTLHILGQLDAAEASLRKALFMEPESEEVLCELAMVLLAHSKGPEALRLVLRGLERAPTLGLKMAFGRCAASTRFRTSEANVRTALTTALRESWGVAYQLYWPAVDLVMLDARIGSRIRLASEKWPRRVPRAELFGAEGLSALASDSLLHAVLEATPVVTLGLEHFLTNARRALLEVATSAQPPDPADMAALRFFAALARQCFINEYVFECDESERAAATTCRTQLLALLDSRAVVPELLLLAVAAYFPLYTLPEPGRLLTPDQHAPIDEVLRQQVREPLEEQSLRTGIQRLTSLSDGVSSEVREQYEENPYPRWVALPIRQPALSFNEELRRMFPLSALTPLPDDRQPAMLIAGCGTGRESIFDAQMFRGVRVLALDLSLSSISYALRKTRELGITNIEYAQADIVKLGELDRAFDIIASVGVLHHLADPFSGWRTLLSLLRSGGFMHLGFYSELARAHVSRARAFIAARGYACTPEDIRRFRRDLAAADMVGLQWLSQMPDFYSTSECRDLVFHVQEHCLTLDQIAAFLSEMGLRFIGFELDGRLLHQYRMRFPDDLAATDLANWALFEADNPDTFASMYQFWVQRPN